MSAEKKPEVPAEAATESTPAHAPPKTEAEAPDPDEDDLDDLDGLHMFTKRAYVRLTGYRGP